MNANMPGQLLIEDAKLLHGNFKNFGGQARKFNAAGMRNFCVRLDPALAEQLRRDRWNIKELAPRPEDEDQEITYYLKVNVNYNSSKPPRIVLMSSGGRSEITEDLVSMLDGVSMEKVDILINPSSYDVNPAMGGTGISAYLKSMFVTIEEDYLERKYSAFGMQPASEGLEADGGL